MILKKKQSLSMTAPVRMLQLFLQQVGDEQHHLALSTESEYLQLF